MNFIKKIQPIIIIILLLICVVQLYFFKNRNEELSIIQKDQVHSIIPKSPVLQPINPNVVSNIITNKIPFIDSTLLSSTYFEEFIYRVLNPFRSSGSDSISLRQSDIDLVLARHNALSTAKKLAQQIEQALQNDYNQDGQIDSDEMEKIKRISIRSNAPYMFNKVIELDLNGDGIVDQTEIFTLKENPLSMPIINNRHVNNLKSLLELDPNKDGVLTIDELKEVATNIFKLADTNNDGILSTPEKEIFVIVREDERYKKSTIQDEEKTK